MAKQTKKQVREDIVNFLTKISAEGGIADFFTSYSSPESLADRPWVPAPLLAAARAFVASHETLEAEIKKLRDEHGIDEQETEY